jgi:hypothetical protein
MAAKTGQIRTFIPPCFCSTQPTPRLTGR